MWRIGLRHLFELHDLSADLIHLFNEKENRKQNSFIFADKLFDVAYAMT